MVYKVSVPKIASIIIVLMLTMLSANVLMAANSSVVPVLREITAKCPSPCCLDIAFALDVSGSMGETVDTLTKLDYLKEAMYIFINRTCPDEGFAIGIVIFNTTAMNITTDAQGLGALWLVDSDVAKKDLNDSITPLVADGLTNMGGGISNATAMILHGIYNKTGDKLLPNRAECRDIIILVTDGLPTEPGPDPEGYAADKADEARAHGIMIVGVYVGDPSGGGDEFLESISDYFINVSIEDLPEEFDKLFDQICYITPPKPAVGGVLEESPVTDQLKAQLVPVILVAAITASLVIFLRRKEK
mgnify:CR=1 FL=1